MRHVAIALGLLMCLALGGCPAPEEVKTAVVSGANAAADLPPTGFAWVDGIVSVLGVALTIFGVRAGVAVRGAVRYTTAAYDGEDEEERLAFLASKDGAAYVARLKTLLDAAPKA